ncbi:MAG TPA: hypothetical protein VES38_06740 [Methylotenera sp.]|nr:hypothetical protein [Methylotenera sp.]
MKTIYRNRRLLDLAHKVTTCMFGLPPCIGVSIEGCEPAHSNHSVHGKGYGIKAADDQHVAGCSECHRYYDANKMPRAEALKAFEAGRARTFIFYESQGWLKDVGYCGLEIA